MTTVSLVDVRKSYGETPVVRGVSLEVDAGEFLVLVGPSGCGKSTCLRMIAGLEEVTGGEVRIGGVRVNEKPPRDRDIGMVFQSYALYPHMTVRENLAFGLTLRKVAKAEIDMRVAEAARMLALEPLLSRRPKELSGGQRQRVAIGRAVVRRPSLFLFDEPLSNLDAALRVQMRAEILALHRRLGTTMVYVTHDQVEAMTLATRIAVLEVGVLQQVGTPDELFHRPANRFVAGFIGSPAMNFLEGRWHDGAFEGGGLTLAMPEVRVDAGPASLGIRPHDLSLAARGIPGTVAVVESMGWESYLHVDTEAGRLVARVEGGAQGLSAGSRVHLDAPVERLHLFGADGRTVRFAGERHRSRVTA
jgi:multiple sugar transport system ATP-binding protein